MPLDEVGSVVRPRPELLAAVVAVVVVAEEGTALREKSEVTMGKWVGEGGGQAGRRVKVKV